MARLSLIFSGFLSVCILILLAGILADSTAYRLAKPAPSSATAPSGRPVRTEQNLRQFSPILDVGLFGPATKGSLTPIIPSVKADATPATPQSDLLLIGTAVGSARSSYAVVRRSTTKEERVFRLGERVFDLGTLTAVRRDAAVITSNSGQNSTLRTPDAAVETAPLAAPALPGQRAARGIIPPTGSGNGVIEQQALNAALDNIGQAMTDARLLPSVKDGTVEGFRLSEVKPQGVFGAIGLKNGDVLRMINDYPIDSPEKAIQSFMTLKGQTRIKLDLIRDGVPTSLSYDIR